MKIQLIFKYIGMGIIAMLLAMCNAGGNTGDTGGDTTIDINTYTFSYEATPQGTATTLSPTWNEDISNVTYAIDGWVDNTETNKATIDASTGIVTIATDTIAGSYTISATGSGSYSGTATAKVYVTVAPAPTGADATGKAALTTAIDEGINAWGDAGDFNYIKTENITDMSNLFKDSYPTFNGNISAWDTSNVTNMSSMFDGASAFNQPIGNWNTSAVENMALMFNQATLFNQPIGNWNTNKVTNMKAMFYQAITFNKDIKTVIDPAGDGSEAGKTSDDRWNMSAVTNISNMFYEATSFKQDIDNWNVGTADTSFFMFTYSGMANNLPCWYEGTTANYFSCFTLSYDLSPQGTAATVSPIWKKKSDGNTVTVTATYKISHDTPVGTVTAPTTSTDASTGEVTIATGTTAGSYTVTVTTIGNHSITTPLTITVAPAPDPSADPASTDPKVRDRATGKAALTTAINDGITIWGNEGDFNYIITSAVTDMETLFQDIDTTDDTGYQLFNGDITKWNTGAVTNMRYMFYGAAKFNQPIGNWNTSKVEDMMGMFFPALSFNQDLDNWNVGAVEADKDHFIFRSSAMTSIPCWYDNNADGGNGAIRDPRPDDCPVAD